MACPTKTTETSSLCQVILWYFAHLFLLSLLKFTNILVWPLDFVLFLFAKVNPSEWIIHMENNSPPLVIPLYVVYSSFERAPISIMQHSAPERTTFDSKCHQHRQTFSWSGSTPTGPHVLIWNREPLNHTHHPSPTYTDLHYKYLNSGKGLKKLNWDQSKDRWA